MQLTCSTLSCCIKLLPPTSYPSRAFVPFHVVCSCCFLNHLSQFTPSPSRLNSGVRSSILTSVWTKCPLHVLPLPQGLPLSQPVVNSLSSYRSVLPLDHEFLRGRPYILLSFILTSWHRARFIADSKQMSVAQMSKSFLSSLHVPTTENSELCTLLPFGRDLTLKFPILGKRNFHVPRNTRCFPALAMN